MFWLLIFLIALGLLAYRGAHIKMSIWVIAGLIVAYGILGDSLILFLILVLVWLVVSIPLASTTLRHEWLSRPMLDRFRRGAQSLPEDTLAALDSDNPGADASLLSGSANWATLRAIKASPVDATRQAWLDTEMDAICAALAQSPENADARNHLCAAALGVNPIAPEYDNESEAGEPQPEATSEPALATHASLRAAVCAHAAAAVGPAAWPPCSPLRAGWLGMLEAAAANGHDRDWLPDARQQFDALAVASAGIDPALQACGWAIISTHASGDEGSHAELLIRLRSDLRADHQAARYALLLDFAGSGTQCGSTGVILDADAPGLTIKPTRDGRFLLAGTAIRAPLSALVEGVRGIGCGRRHLTRSIATAQAIHAPA
ncbi:MAG: hypothetical protein L0H29_02885, partial [Sinobacteraceae bacterium]|nr:hypothetical protein [Nevskiaceae bacterium]